MDTCIKSRIYLCDQVCFETQPNTIDPDRGYLLSGVEFINGQDQTYNSRVRWLILSAVRSLIISFLKECGITVAIINEIVLIRRYS